LFIATLSSSFNSGSWMEDHIAMFNCCHRSLVGNISSYYFVLLEYADNLFVSLGTCFSLQYFGHLIDILLIFINSFG
jgi:hypothetical protein